MMELVAGLGEANCGLLVRYIVLPLCPGSANSPESLLV